MQNISQELQKYEVTYAFNELKKNTDNGISQHFSYSPTHY